MSADIAAYALAAEAGRLEEAERGLEAVLAREPAHVEALALSAWIANARGDDAACRRRLDAVLALDPDHRAALTIALALANRRGEPAALALAARLAALEPASALAQFNLGNTRARFGDAAGARAALDRALELEPGFVGVRRARAWLALEAGDTATARRDFELALEAFPNDASMHVALGIVALRGFDGATALPHFERALALDRRSGPAWRGLSQALELAGGDPRRAVEASSRAVEAMPDDAEGWFEHAKCLSRYGHAIEARAAAVRALELAPAWLPPRWLLFQALPYPHADADAVARAAKAWRAGLAAFEALPLSDPGTRAQVPDLLTLQPNFHRHYLGDDITADQRRYGALVTRMVESVFPAPIPRRAARAGTRRRVGFASAHLRRHTIWKLFHRWLALLDRSRFEVVALYLGPTVDDTVRGLGAIADEVVGPIHTNDGWIEALRAARLDALVWLDVGMDGLTQLLAPQRFAPLQCATWGHPVTTGFAAIDAFLSGDAMEPARGEAHYTERLVRLPGLGIAYAMPPEAEGYARPRRGTAPPRYVCPQSIHKLLPVHDALFARVLAAVPGATLDLTPHPVAEVRERLAARMRPAFAAYGVDFDARVRLHPYLSETKFLALLRDSDVLLDSVGWSGGNTTLEALAFDLPVVTLPGQFMRARHTHGIVAGLGLADRLSARDADDYVAIATRLGSDAGFHADVAATLHARKRALYEDEAGVRALERFLLESLG